MPLEGHWARQHAPFLPDSRRELRALVVAGVVALATTLVIAFAIVTASHPSASPGCKRTTVATSTGGATIERCYKTDK